VLITTEARTCTGGHLRCSAVTDLGEWPAEPDEHSHIVPQLHERCHRCGEPFASPESAVLVLPRDFLPDLSVNGREL